jgi:poly(beta-D-mannuronate) lyase
MSFIVDGARYPTHLLPYVAENYIAGPSQDYFVQDAGYLDRRGHGRHYMAWVERAAGTFPEAAGAARMRLLAEREVLPERPLIDEFSAGNATCFWASTATNLQGVGR